MIIIIIIIMMIIMIIIIIGPSWKTSTQNEQMSTRSTRTRIDDPPPKRTTLIQKDPCKGIAPNNKKINNVPTYDVENTNGTNKGRNLFLAYHTPLLGQDMTQGQFLSGV